VATTSATEGHLNPRLTNDDHDQNREGSLRLKAARHAPVSAPMRQCLGEHVR